MSLTDILEIKNYIYDLDLIFLMSRAEILKKYGDKRDELITTLQKIQDEEGYISPKAIVDVAIGMKIPISEVYGVVTFYNFFKLKPGGKYLIQMCRGTACHVKGSKELFDYLKTKLDINDDETTKDGLYTLSGVNCLGMCSLAPCMVINGQVYSNLTKQKLDDALKLLK